MKFNYAIKRMWSGFLIFLGSWLSPLSPWNDLFTNIPLAYLFALPFSMISESLFLPMAILGYWISNVLGFLLMHLGYIQMQDKNFSLSEHWKKYILVTTVYTFVIALLIYFEILPTMNELISFFTN